MHLKQKVNFRIVEGESQPDVDFEEYFDDIIGVTVPEDTEPVDVLLRVRNYRANFIRTKPLHLTQRIIKETKDFTTFSINVKINKELIALIMSFDSDAEVLSPASLREEIGRRVKAMNDIYQNYEKNLQGE